MTGDERILGFVLEWGDMDKTRALKHNCDGTSLKATEFGIVMDVKLTGRESRIEVSWIDLMRVMAKIKGLK